MINKQAIIAGHICLGISLNLPIISNEVLQSTHHLMELDEEQNALYSAGGVVSNVGLSLHRMGIPARMIGKIGDDWYGKVLQECLEKETHQHANDLVVDLTLPTGLTIMINSSRSECRSIYHPGANNTFYASDMPRYILESGDLLHFGSPALMRSIYRCDGAEMVSILIKARKAGLSASLDVSRIDQISSPGQINWVEFLANTLPLTDILTIKFEDLLLLLDRSTHQKICKNPQVDIDQEATPELLNKLAQKVLNHGVKAIFVTMRNHGIYLETAPAERWKKSGRALDCLDSRWYNREIWAPALRTEVHSTIDTNDAAPAGFIASILNETDPITALQMATATAALSFEGGTFYSNFPSWDQIWGRIQQGWDRLPLDLAKFGWQEDPANGLWSR